VNNLLYTLLWVYLNIKICVQKVLVAMKMIVKNETTFYPKTVLEFERKFAEFSNVRHSITFANGTTAIEAAIYALGLRKGDEVLSPAYTIPSTFAPIVNSGGTIKFVDIDTQTFNVCLEDFNNKISSKTKGIIIVHLWGAPVNMDKVMKIAKQHKIWVIEDCSHAHGAKFSENSVGSIGDIGVFSLQGSKAIAAGEGGIAVTNSSTHIDKMLFYAHQGRESTGTLLKDSSKSKRTYGGGRKSRAHPIGIGLAMVDLNNIHLKNRIKLFFWEFVANSINECKYINIQKKIDLAEFGGFFGGASILIDEHVLENVFKILKDNSISYYNNISSSHHKNKYYSKGVDQILPNTDLMVRASVIVNLDQFILASRRGKLKKAVNIINDL